MRVNLLDHLVLTVRDLAVTIEFYKTVLGMQPVKFGIERVALVFGQSKINLHEANKEFEPKALRPTPGSADLCFVTDLSMQFILAHLMKTGVPIEVGPVSRTGAIGPIESVYIRDPDKNLIEIAIYRRAD